MGRSFQSFNWGLVSYYSFNYLVPFSPSSRSFLSVFDQVALILRDQHPSCFSPYLSSVVVVVVDVSGIGVANVVVNAVTAVTLVVVLQASLAAIVVIVFVILVVSVLVILVKIFVLSMACRHLLQLVSRTWTFEWVLLNK